MLISGFNFSLHFMVWRRRNFLIYLQDAEAKAWIATAALMSALTIIVLADAHVYERQPETVRHALFSVVSVIDRPQLVSYASWPLSLPVLTFSRRRRFSTLRRLDRQQHQDDCAC